MKQFTLFLLLSSFVNILNAQDKKSQPSAVVSTTEKSTAKEQFAYKVLTVHADENGNFVESSKETLMGNLKESMQYLSESEYAKAKEELYKAAEHRSSSSLLNYYGSIGYELVDVVSYSNEKYYTVTFYLKKKLTN